MEISSYPCKCIIFIIKVINYALYVTYMTRIDYNALLTPLIAKACVVQWIECRTPDSGAESSNHGVVRYFFFIYREVYRICSDFYLYSR